MLRDVDLGSDVRECFFVWYFYYIDLVGRRDFVSMVSSKINRTG